MKFKETSVAVKLTGFDEVVRATLENRARSSVQALLDEVPLYSAITKLQQPLTRRERIARWCSMWRGRFADAWLVLRGRADIC